MVSIHRLPPSINPQQKPRVSKTPTSQPATEPTAVSKAVSKNVSQSMRSADHSALIQEARSHIQYDQPEGKHRDAVSSYLDVMNQQKRDELSAMIGVDMYA
ncbi:hypothetical protein [Photobacterium sanguinicancri]|uniref:Chromosome partitioning protein ParA n=1 Tax=Photobacterium sanguinicancri TaxID=875932 RepID=A0AAW7XYC8_9GAMM|nr:hypothetical protein [Photobacterium sanguinicancri]KXI23152.1 hypothetical protein AS132_09790 [Photobacterium sanguinicancri]MDO6497422.1 hypothetical protein [Photobacterium sanguinicancri]MDO6540952.1 hypothetical protein [Photobacterium sanguinicancri]OZS43966.1 hypothetical protein ASV53_10515 [Photobacterium sanguinicancri]